MDALVQVTHMEATVMSVCLTAVIGMQDGKTDGFTLTNNMGIEIKMDVQTGEGGGGKDKGRKRRCSDKGCGKEVKFNI